MWKVDRVFFFLGLDLFSFSFFFPFFFPSFLSFSLFFHSLSLFFQFFTSFSLFLPLFHSFSNFLFLFPSFYFFFFFFSLFLFLPFFTFFSFHRLFHIVSRFSPFSPHFFAFFFAFSLAWPRPQLCRLALPSLTLPHIASPLLSFLNTLFLISKEHRDFQQISVLRKKFLPTKKADHFKVHPCVQWSTLETNCHSKCIMSVRCVWSEHAPRSVQCRTATLMSKAVIKLCVHAGTLERCVFVFLVFWWNRRRAVFFAISLVGVLASSLAWLNCPGFLAGAILLERGCVVSGVRFSSAMLAWVAFEAWVFH